MIRPKKLFFIVVVIFLIQINCCWSITTTFSEVVLENVQIGESYNFRVLRNLPLVLTNNRTEIEDTTIKIEIPQKDNLKPGYEPVPDIEWLQVIPNKFRLAPGESGQSDIILTIPNDEKYIGKHYQADIVSEGMPVGPPSQLTISLSIRNRVRFSIGSKGPALLLAEKKAKKMRTLNFELDPVSIKVKESIEVGKKINLKKEKNVKLNLINKASESLSIKMKAIPYEPRYGATEGYEIGNPEFLKIKPESFKLKGETIRKLDLYIQIPNEEKYKNKKFVFFIMAEVINGVPVEIYSKLFLTTEENK